MLQVPASSMEEVTSNDYHLQKQNKKELRKITRRIEQLEAQCEDLDSQITQLQEAMLEWEELAERVYFSKLPKENIVMTENDWFMNQIKGVADIIGTTLRLQIQNLDLGQYEDEEGRLINGNHYLQQVLEEQRFAEAISFVEEQMKRLPLHQYDLLVDWLISYLRQLDFSVKEEHGFYEGYLQELERYLKEFKW